MEENNDKKVEINDIDLEQKEKKEKSKLQDFIEWVVCILIAVVLALAIRYYIGTPTIVKQPSMYPTLHQNERLILNRWFRTTKKMPKRGDIITFEAPSETYVLDEEILENSVVAKYNNEPDTLIEKFVYHVLEIGKTSYIKRVIALPGEHVEIKNDKVYINGSELEEEYLNDTVVTTSLNGIYTDLIVPNGCIFAMGDNRTQSADCRRFGCIPLEKIESKVLIRFWPLNKIGKVK